MGGGYEELGRVIPSRRGANAGRNWTPNLLGRDFYLRPGCSNQPKEIGSQTKLSPSQIGQQSLLCVEREGVRGEKEE